MKTHGWLGRSALVISCAVLVELALAASARQADVANLQPVTLSASMLEAEIPTVQVTVSGVQLTDPVEGTALQGQGHLRYQVDGGPLIATTATKLSFHGLAAGSHTIAVTLASSDHVPLASASLLTVTLP